MAHVRYTPTEDSASFTRWYKLMLDPKAEIPVTSLNGGLEADTAGENAAISAHLTRLDRYNQKSTLTPLDGLPITHWGVSRLLQYAFFLLDSGYMGTGFHHCRQGDFVYILEGAHCPVVLRLSGVSYRFVAAAYVHGVMNGESWPDDGNTLEGLTLEQKHANRKHCVLLTSSDNTQRDEERIVVAVNGGLKTHSFCQEQNEVDRNWPCCCCYVDFAPFNRRC